VRQCDTWIYGLLVFLRAGLGLDGYRHDFLFRRNLRKHLLRSLKMMPIIVVIVPKRF
jgi:hypothetical protein